MVQQNSVKVKLNGVITSYLVTRLKIKDSSLQSALSSNTNIKPSNLNLKKVIKKKCKTITLLILIEFINIKLIIYLHNKDITLEKKTLTTISKLSYGDPSIPWRLSW